MSAGKRKLEAKRKAAREITRLPNGRFPPRNDRRYTEEQIAEAIKKNKGLLYAAADSLDMSHTAISLRIKASEWLQEIVKDAKQIRIDIAESKLMELHEEKNVASLIFFLKTMGRSRGYDESAKPEISPETEKLALAVLQQMSALQKKKED